MKHLTRTLILTVLSVLLILVCTACGDRAPDYSKNEAYSHLYTDEDTADAVNLKNVIIAHLEAYNAADAEGYFALFDMEKDDRAFNIMQFESMRQTVDLTYTPESIYTAFLNEDNAQALITVTCKATDKATGAVQFYYRTELTYTMVRDGKWKITLNTPGAEEDLMYTLTTESAES